MTRAEPNLIKPTTIKALIITNSPDRLRSSILLNAHNNWDWIDSSICSGIPGGNSRRDLESKIIESGLPLPPDVVYDGLSLSEIGCAYAHMNALTIAAKREEPTLIFEDDAEFDPDKLRQILSNLDWLPYDAILKLEGYAKDGGRIVIGPKNEDLCFALSLRPSNGCAGYVVTPYSASCLLEASFGYVHPIDMMLNDPTKHGCFLLDAVPFPIKQSATVTSTIKRGNKKPGFVNKLVRHREKLIRRLARYSSQLRRARKAGFTRIRFAKFYEN